MTPRHASASRLLRARIARRSRKAAFRAYVAVLALGALATGIWTVYASASGGPS